MDSQWLQLAKVIDLSSSRILGWSLDTHMRSDLVEHALNHALQSRPMAAATITLFHSGRGS